MRLKQPEEYIDYHEINPGFTVALDVLSNGNAAIIANAGHVATAWEYHNVVAAQAAWHAWRPLSGVEPQGYARRHDASSKVKVEAL